MKNEQETLIYIEQNDKDEAAKLSRGFAIEDVKNRAYINVLGSELAMKYLALEDISVSNIYNLHNIHRIREEFDIADIMLPNIHIDVRMIYDEDLIFIPKSHFKYGLTPDIYLVFLMQKDTFHVKFMGFFEPKLINKNNQNDEYYFIEKEKLSHPLDLKSYIEKFNGNTTRSISEEEHENALRLAVSLIDHDITNDDKQNLINLLLKCSALREDLIEFDDFELISYHAATNEDIKDLDHIGTNNILADEFELFDKNDEFENFDTDENITEEFSDKTIQTTEETVTDEVETIESDAITETDEIDNIFQDLTPDNGLIDNPLEAIESQDEIPDLTLENDLTDSTPDDIDMQEENVPLEQEDLNLDDNLIDDVPDDTDMQEEDIPLEQEDLNLDDNLIDDVPDDTDMQEENIPLEQEDDLNLDDNLIDDVPDDTDMQEENIPLEQEDDLNLDDNLIDDLPDDTGTQEENVPLEQDFSADDIPENESEIETVSPETINLEQLSTETSELSADDFLEALAGEQSVQQPVSFENSTAINNNEEDFTPGEIIIDINQRRENPEKNNEPEKLEVLYNENSDVLNSVDEDFELKTYTPEKGKKAIILATTIVVALAGLLIYASLNKTGNQTVEKEVSSPLEDHLSLLDEQQLPEDDNIITQTPKLEDAAGNIQTSKTPIAESPYLNVKKLTWAIPDYVSYNTGFKNFLQTAGKSLKLSLSSDLLLATEYAYSNVIDVDISLTKDGSIQDAKIIQSSGSTQIDSIVLRTVKDTLKVLKAPAGVIIGDNIHLTLKIYI